MANHNIKYADYDDGQPESEKRGLHIRNRAGDNRVSIFGIAFVAIPLIVGGIFAIPAVAEFREGRQNLAEIAFGSDASEYESDAQCASREIRVADLHAAKDLTDATALEVTILVQTRSKGTVARASNTVSLEGIDLDTSRLDHGISAGDLVATNPNSRPALCGYEVKIVR